MIPGMVWAIPVGAVLVIAGAVNTLRRDPTWDGWHWPSDGLLLTGMALALMGWLLG